VCHPAAVRQYTGPRRGKRCALGPVWGVPQPTTRYHPKGATAQLVCSCRTPWLLVLWGAAASRHMLLTWAEGPAAGWVGGRRLWRAPCGCSPSAPLLNSAAAASRPVCVLGTWHVACRRGSCQHTPGQVTQGHGGGSCLTLQHTMHSPHCNSVNCLQTPQCRPPQRCAVSQAHLLQCMPQASYHAQLLMLDSTCWTLHGAGHVVPPRALASPLPPACPVMSPRQPILSELLPAPTMAGGRLRCVTPLVSLPAYSCTGRQPADHRCIPHPPLPPMPRQGPSGSKHILLPLAISLALVALHHGDGKRWLTICVLS
jgi:hypothetical protein